LIRMDDNTFDPVNGSMDVAPRVKIYLASQANSSNV
jgi:hypothetical protein